MKETRTEKVRVRRLSPGLAFRMVDSDGWCVCCGCGCGGIGFGGSSEISAIVEVKEASLLF